MLKLNKKIIITSMLILLTVILILPFKNHVASPEKTIKAEKGTLNLSRWDFITNSVIKLDGEWEFYWDKLLSYNDLKNLRPEVYATVPHFWNDYTINGEKLNSQGYCTYKLHVITNLLEDTSMGLKINTFSSAYKLFVNDKLIAENGKVSNNPQDEVGEYRPQAVIFYTPAKEFDIIIQVSNHNYSNGGFWYSIWLGRSSEIVRLDYRDVIQEAMLVGALIVISLFYFAVFYIKRDLKYSLYLALMSLSMALSLDMLGQMLIKRLFLGLSFRFTVLLWYTSTTWVFFFTILYLNELYKSRFSKIILKLYLIKAVLLQLLYLLTPTSFFSKTASITNIFDSIIILCVVVIVAIGIKNGKKDGWLNIISMFVLFIAYIYDIIFISSIKGSRFGEMIYAGVFVAIIIQMIVQARKTSEYFENKLAADIAFMQAQIKPHFLYNALNTIAELCEVEGEKAGKLITSLGTYLRGSLVFENLEDTVCLKDELETVKAYVAIEKARFINLKVEFLIDSDIVISIPPLALQPLVENSIRHGVRKRKEGGTVVVTITKVHHGVLFRVEDNGVGIEENILERIRRNNFQHGSVGLYNINNRLMKMYGKGLTVESEAGKWTRVTFVIPRKG